MEEDNEKKEKKRQIKLSSELTEINEGILAGGICTHCFLINKDDYHNYHRYP